jgi:hypothetical protein
MLERERESVCVHTCESGSGCVKWVCEKERERERESRERVGMGVGVGVGVGVGEERESDCAYSVCC